LTNKRVFTAITQDVVIIAANALNPDRGRLTPEF